MHPANICVPITETEWFITNPVYKTADIVGSDIISALSRAPVTPDESMVEHLSKQGYITEEHLSLPEVYKNLPPEKDSELSFAIALTYNCNLDCVYCFQKIDSATSTLTTEKIEKLSEAINSLKRKFLVFSPSHITWELTGGEPLLPGNRGILEQLFDIIGSNRVLITTNGTHISDFVDVLSSRHTMLKVTLDGTPSVHDTRRKTSSGKGTYHDIVEGVKKAREAGIPVTIKVNIDSSNSGNLHQLVDRLKSYGWLEDEGVVLGLAQVKATPEYLSVLTDAEYVEYMCAYLEAHNLQPYFEVTFSGCDYFEDIILGKNPKTSIYRCKTDRIFFFSPDGLIYPCIRMSQYPVGRYFPELFLDDAQITPLKSRTIKVILKCLQCKYALLCRGGCPADSLELYGSLFNPLCIDYPRILKAYIPYLLRNRSRGYTAQPRRR